MAAAAAVAAAPAASSASAAPSKDAVEKQLSLGEVALAMCTPPFLQLLSRTIFAQLETLARARKVLPMDSAELRTLMQLLHLAVQARELKYKYADKDK